MGIFSTIMDKIFHHPAAQAVVPTPQPEPATADTAADTAPVAAPAPEAQAVPASVDVGAVLEQIANEKGGGGNYETSIVDLLKLLDMDSSLDARKELANEFNVHVGEDGSAEENIALHQAVMDQLAANGGKIPDNLRH